jgi:hypothetical protein
MSTIVCCEEVGMLTDFKKHNVIKGIINDKRKRPRRYSEENESIHSRCSGIAGYTTMPATRTTRDDACGGLALRGAELCDNCTIRVKPTSKWLDVPS